MPLEVVVELQIRAISCPGVFLPDKHDVFLGVYLLNQYLETDCFPSMFPIMVQRSMRFEKVFENAIDPGAVADILESFLTRFELIQLVSPVWQELAYYEENTRDFLFPEPRLTPSHPGMCREVLMKTVEGFPFSLGTKILQAVLRGQKKKVLLIGIPDGHNFKPSIIFEDLGIAPKIEFSTRTAIRERVFLHRNRFFEERRKSQRPLSTPNGPKFPLSCVKMKPRESNIDRVPPGMQSRPLSPYCTRRFFQDQPAQLNLGYTFKIPGESKPPFVVDSAKPFGENSSQHHSQKSRRKPNFSNFPFPVRRVSSLDSLGANVKVIKEPDERIVLRNESPSSLDSSKFGKPSPSYSNQGDADFHQETSFDTSQNSRSPSPLLDQPLLRERPHPGFQSTWKKIHERVCSLLTSHRAQQHLNKEESISEIKNILNRPGYPLKKYRAHEQKYF